MTNQNQFENDIETHWYLEPLSALSREEDGRLTLDVTTQHVSHVQESVAYALQMNQSDVSVQVRRLGGGFGGKGARSDLIGIRKVCDLPFFA